MESKFGYNFGNVKIHTGKEAADSAEMIMARAYTIGEDIIFAEGQYRPNVSEGRKLLAHELMHVVQQSTGPKLVQLSPKDKPQVKQANLDLPWRHGDYTLFVETNSGIRFLVGIGAEKENQIRSAIKAIGKQVSADNRNIQDPDLQVMTVFIVPTTTRFALWTGIPVLMLDPPDANMETAAHEMGHAIFHYLNKRREQKSTDSARAHSFLLTVADIFARLSQTKQFTFDEKTAPAGLWIADPTQWRPGSKGEHPFDDPDEFFASAKEAYQIDLKGLKNTITRFKNIDINVVEPWNELLSLLDGMSKRKLITRKLPKERSSVAEKEVERVTGVSRVEETIMSGTLLDWLVNPASRPEKREYGPSLQSPFP
jgi:hypothetical protein